MSALTLCAAVALAASGTVPAASPPRWVVSLQAPSLLARGAELQGERYLGEAQRWSLALSAGARAPVEGTYRALQLNLGVEGRRFLWRTGPGAAFQGQRLGGLFLFAREDVGYVDLWRGSDGTQIARAWQSETAFGAGYRFLPGWRIELTPSVGAALDFNARVGDRVFPTWGPRLQLGLTVGVLL